MTKQLLFCALLTATAACRQDADVQPSSVPLDGEVAGLYRTNVYLDPSCVAMPTSQMPYVELKQESNRTFTLVYTNQYPALTVRQIPNVSLNRQPETILLRIDGATIGTLATDRVFTSSGMEKNGQLLRLTLPTELAGSGSSYFVGTKQ